MSTKHTPGPWFASDKVCVGPTVIHNRGGCFEIVTSEDRNTANVLCTRFPWPEKAEEMSANARLIAAAPELLEALLMARRLVNEALPKFNWDASCLDAKAIRLLNEAPAAIDAAIARATGSAA